MNEINNDVKKIEGTLLVVDCSNRSVVYRDYGKWLYPLFNFESFLHEQSQIETKNLYVIDTIIGKGAAVLLIYMGIVSCYAHVMSSGAVSMLKKHHVTFQYHQLVETIGCQTEKIIDENEDIADMYQMLLLRKKH